MLGLKTDVSMYRENSLKPKSAKNRGYCNAMSNRISYERYAYQAFHICPIAQQQNANMSKKQQNTTDNTGMHFIPVGSKLVHLGDSIAIHAKMRNKKPYLCLSIFLVYSLALLISSLIAIRLS